ncbi:MAG: DNA primase [Candidatus Omnitrophica bacterium]|nr:DNA primase [Candidatus Omnitrophota bacterium]
MAVLGSEDSAEINIKREMSGRLPDNFLEEILSRVDIVEIISGFIPLKRTGRNFKAHCPFHHEKTPSFMISPDRQIYHCFGCGESGNAFKFLMRYERMSFLEAVEYLAKKAGLPMPQRKGYDQKAEGIAIQLYKINELAALFYEEMLNSAQGASAKRYLLKRGIEEDVIRMFKLGLAPDKWDALISHLRQKGINLSLLEKAGLILAKEGGGFYDRFRSRIIIPIFDIKNRVLGFGARVLDDSSPKYINSPETPIYTKGKHLYGLSFAKDAIKEEDFVVVVEGYMDFLLPFQAGLKNIVASLGTALTLDQVRLIRRYTHNVVIIYDPDTAGQLAALRSLDIFVEEEMNAKVVTLPHGLDPDLLVRKNGIGDLKEKIKRAQGIFEYKLGILKSRYDKDSVDGKARISAEMLETIVKFKNAVLKSEYIRCLAQELDVREDALWQESKKAVAAKTPPVSPEIKTVKKTHTVSPTERLLLKLMLEETELVHQLRDSISPEDFFNEKISRVVSVMFELISQGKNIEPRLLIDYLEDNEISEIIGESTFLPEELSGQDKERVVRDCIQRLKDEKLRLRRQHLHEQIKTAQDSGDNERLQQLVKEFHALIKKGN